MNEKIQYQYYHSNALLVINSKGLMRIIYTPFRVICIVTTGKIPKDARVFVEEVVTNNHDQLQYFINGQLYVYKHFFVPINF